MAVSIIQTSNPTGVSASSNVSTYKRVASDGKDVFVTIDTKKVEIKKIEFK